MMPRLVNGPEYCGKSLLRAMKAASASGSFFCFISCTASLKRACGSPLLGGATGLPPAEGRVPPADGALGPPFLLKPEQPAISATAIDSATNLLERFISLVPLLALGILARRKAGERELALLHPVVVDALADATQIRLVRLDRLLLEREGLLFEQQTVLLELRSGHLLRPLRVEQGARERLIERADLVGRRGGHVGDAVARGARQRVDRLLERDLLRRDALVERLRERDRVRGGDVVSTELQARARGERLALVAALGAGESVGGDEVLLDAQIVPLVAVALVDLGEAHARIERAIDRLGEVLDVELVGRDRLRLIVRLVVERRRLP